MKETGKSLLIGSIGGGIFFLLDLPLAWMLGSMCIATVFAVRGVQMHVDATLRKIMTAVLGVMLGSSFSADTVASLMGWSGGLLLLILSIFLSMGVVYIFYRKFCNFDRITSYFSASPGGFNIMYEAGEAAGGDGRTIALVHATRILLLVMVIPLVFNYGLTFENVSESTSLSVWGDPNQLKDYALLAIAGVAGYFGGIKLKLPAPHLMGPLIIVAALQVTEISSSEPPMILVYAAQLVIGTAIGLRFLGSSFREVRRIILISCVSTSLMMVVVVFLSYEATSLISVSIPGLVLALAPGGLAEMALVALALGIDVAFVSVMHVVRIMLIIALIPALYPVTQRAWHLKDRIFKGQPPA